MHSVVLCIPLPGATCACCDEAVAYVVEMTLTVLGTVRRTVLPRLPPRRLASTTVSGTLKRKYTLMQEQGPQIRRLSAVEFATTSLDPLTPAQFGFLQVSARTPIAVRAL